MVVTGFFELCVVLEHTHKQFHHLGEFVLYWVFLIYKFLHDFFPSFQDRLFLMSEIWIWVWLLRGLMTLGLGIRTFGVMYSHAVFYVCKSPNQATRPQVKWTASLVITYGYCILPEEFVLVAYLWVNIYSLHRPSCLVRDLHQLVKYLHCPSVQL